MVLIGILVYTKQDTIIKSTVRDTQERGGRSETQRGETESREWSLMGRW